MSRAIEYCREMVSLKWYHSKDDEQMGHFRSKRNFHFFFKWVPAAFSFSFAFLTILDLNTILIFSQNGHWWPFWMSEIHFCLHFWPFQIKMQLYFFCSKWSPAAISGHFRWKRNFLKMAAGGHFGYPKLIFVCISRLFSPFSFAFHYNVKVKNLRWHAQLYQSS